MKNVLQVFASKKAELFEHVLLHRGSAGPVSYSSLFESKPRTNLLSLQAAHPGGVPAVVGVAAVNLEP